jgi:hypothetical protein
MRRVMEAMSVLLAAVAVGSMVGCGPSTDCEEIFTCPPGSGGSGGGGGTPIGCIPSANDKPVNDTCGIFVSSSLGKDGNMGSKSAPVQTLRHALDTADGRPVYACAEVFAGSVTLANGSAIYGGLDCTKQWTYVGAMKKSVLTGDADQVALTLASTAKEAEVVDFTIQAANATAAGGSSLAVLADQVTARLTRCDLIAGDGAAGADGEDAPSMPAQVGTNGSKGGDACSAPKVNGADQVTNTCGIETSVGGSGGDGTPTNGGDGSNGSPPVAGKGTGGNGEAVVGWDCSAGGSNGGAGVGATGEPGKEGAGALTSDLGALTSSGFTSAAGSDGAPGKIGQGGGGGGGAKGGMLECSLLTGNGGASGGSGGAGGCGGAGGKGGKGGGASIALVSYKASLTLAEVTLKTGNGGNGGAGGDLQKGGGGGLGGSGGLDLGIAGVKPGCKGGDGGNGGDGGPGGGGRGGHAIGLAYAGPAPTIGMEQITVGTPGMGGPGGNKNLKANQGAGGLAAQVQVFP